MTPWIDVAGWTLLHFLWQGAALALLGAALLALMRHRSARGRYALAALTLAAMIAAPLVTAARLARAEASRPAAIPAGAAHGASVAQPIPAASAVSARPASADAPLEAPRVLPWVVGLWTAGVVLFTVRLAGGWLRIRRLHRAARAMPPSRWDGAARQVAARLGFTRAFAVVDSPAVETPIVIGWLKPVVLLPVAALAAPTPAQVDAILAHELAHVRRHDSLVNLLQTVAETLLFYHPGVWWLSSRIRLEREHCCDDVALQVCDDRVAYATALTELAAWSIGPAPLSLAATGGALLHRVRHVLGLPTRSRRGSAGAAFVALAAIVLVVGVFRMVPLAQPLAPAGSRGAAVGPPDVNAATGFELLPRPTAFPTDDPRGVRAWDVTVRFASGEMPLVGFSGRSLIRFAYGQSSVPVVDAPAWIDTQSLDLTAIVSNPRDDEEVRGAVRQALEQQLGLRVHSSTREFPVYALILADGAPGVALRPSAENCRPAPPPAAGPVLHQSSEIRAVCGLENTMTGAAANGVTMAEFVSSLRYDLAPLSVGREVIDRTGLSGRYDFELRTGFLPLAALATHLSAARALLGPLGFRSVPAALADLGLQLEDTTAPFDVLVVDNVTPPRRREPQ